MFSACAVISACSPLAPSVAPSVAAPTEAPSSALVSPFDVMERYEQLLAAGEWDSAWDMVSTEQQRAWGSVTDFKANESAFLELGGSAFVVHAPVVDAGRVDAAAKEAGFMSVDPLHAALVTVDRVPVSDNGGWEMFIVGLEAGVPKIWQVR
jgi:hypothetical protein